MSEFTGEHDYRDVLRKAASYVEQGWCQNALARGDGFTWQETYPELHPTANEWCVLGAVIRANHDLTGTRMDGLFGQAWNAVRSHLGTMDEVGWNNAPGRTADEVAEALRRAAE